jgi:hypothetical protein
VWTLSIKTTFVNRISDTAKALEGSDPKYKPVLAQPKEKRNEKVNERRQERRNEPFANVPRGAFDYDFEPPQSSRQGSKNLLTLFSDLLRCFRLVITFVFCISFSRAMWQVQSRWRLHSRYSFHIDAIDRGSSGSFIRSDTRTHICENVRRHRECTRSFLPSVEYIFYSCSVYCDVDFASNPENAARIRHSRSCIVRGREVERVRISSKRTDHDETRNRAVSI